MNGLQVAMVEPALLATCVPTSGCTLSRNSCLQEPGNPEHLTTHRRVTLVHQLPIDLGERVINKIHCLGIRTFRIFNSNVSGILEKSQPLRKIYLARDAQKKQMKETHLYRNEYVEHTSEALNKTNRCMGF